MDRKILAVLVLAVVVLTSGCLAPHESCMEECCRELGSDSEIMRTGPLGLEVTIICEDPDIHIACENGCREVWP